MEIVHRISFNSKRNANAVRQLTDLGIPLEHGPIITGCDVSETNPSWCKIKKIVTDSNLPFITDKRFTEAEIRSSKWVFVRPDYIWGYPMPDQDMGYKSLSFDRASECPVCGAGRRQTAQLRLKGEPSWRGRAFLGINWILDICARPDVVDSMRKQGLSGFEAAPILEHKSAGPLQTVLQLRFAEETACGLLDDNLERESPSCGHVKYIGASREIYRFRADALTGCPDFVQTAQWFGSGHLAVKLVLASSAFANLYMNNAWKGLRLEPVELVVPSETSPPGPGAQEAGEK